MKKIIAFILCLATSQLFAQTNNFNTLDATAGVAKITSGTIAGATITTSTFNGNTLTAGTGTLTLGAGKTLTATNSFNVTGADGTMTQPSGAWTAARTDAGNSFTGDQAIGAAVNTNILLYVTGTGPFGGTSQYGIYSTPTSSSSATGSLTSYYSQPTTAAASFTASNVYGFYADAAAAGAGSTITSAYGLYVANQSAGGTNNYGIYSAVASASTGGYNLYVTGTAPNYFAGNTAIATRAAIGTATINNNALLNAVGTAGGAQTSQYGVILEPTATSSGTAGLYGMYIQPATAAASYLTGNTYGIYLAPVTQGSGSTVTTATSLYVGDPTIGGTNNYGIYSAVASGSGKYNIYVGGSAANNFGAGSSAVGSLAIGSNTVISGTAPSLASGGCTGAAIGTANNTAAFTASVGTSACSGSQPLVFTLPAAAHSWQCNARDINTGANLQQTGAASTTSVTITNYALTTGVVQAWTANDVVAVSCMAY